ncbi:ABC transporter permease subunit [Crossiella sp. CA-258035]|uniref:ABC transporter permease n=1 Tax=Crossiella sp. CA-258035 TaxID=2981138 RepID=UPI0024BCC9FC|nr:ABC transporter permease subunit [Crossiella sp. CA-258035]WHT17588.1 ABC transporter permease subunit [Crossiella sp. CA-258035]
MTAALRSELLAIRKRPAAWLLGACWLAQTLLFTFTVPYIVYRAQSGSAAANPEQAGAMLRNLLPESLVANTLMSFPMFGGAIMVILGAVLMGGEYRWSTWGPLFTQGPGRMAVLLAKFLTMALAVLGIVLATFAFSSVLRLVVAGVEGGPVVFPDPLTVLAGIGACWLLGLACATLGFFLASAFRSTGTGLAVGLVWLLALENAVNGLTFALPAVKAVQTLLIGPSGGAIAAELGARPQGSSGGVAMLVVDVTSVPVAVLVLLGYVLVFLGLSLRLARGRDIQGAG